MKPNPKPAGGGETFTNTRDLVAKIQASCSCRYNGSFPKLSPPFSTWYPRVIFLIMGTLKKGTPYFLGDVQGNLSFHVITTPS